jgi:cellulose synthase/poly-beta-1,6-N-acetylglucosamine synthase-like glycosyltransferase
MRRNPARHHGDRRIFCLKPSRKIETDRTIMATDNFQSSQSNSKKHLVVIIPCFNEEKTIGKVISSIPKTIPGIDTIDILVIDDGSTDNSVSEAL